MQDSNSADEALRIRLTEIARRHPQAEIARRTDTTPSNVSRYLRGNRMPGAFLMGLCTEFGVNPSWLLLGQGPTWAADVVGGSARTGGNLVEMVNAMTRIGKLRLGALAGKAEAKSLRELDDALRSFERERMRLADESREVYSKLLDDWSDALARRDRNSIRHLREAVERVARLCPDDELELRYLNNAATHDQVLYHFDAALKSRRRLFLAQLASSEGMDESVFRAALGLVAILDAMRLTEEGSRHAAAALALAPAGAEQWETYAAGIGLYGWTLVQLGEVGKGSAYLTRALALEKSERGQANIRLALGWLHLMTGAATLCEAADFSRNSPQSVRQLLTLSPWWLDIDEVRALVKRLHESVVDAERSENEHVAQIHLACLQGKKAIALRELDVADAAIGDEIVGIFTLGALRTQVCRLLGLKQQARAAFKLAEKARLQVPGEMTISFNSLRIHWRNAAELGVDDRKTLKEMESFLSWAHARGFQTHVK